MNDHISGIATRVTEAISNAERFCNMARAREFLVAARDALSTLLPIIAGVKTAAKGRADEDGANTCLCYAEMVTAVRSELSMWIALKDDDPNCAWEHLISAQMAARTAMQAHKLAEGLHAYVDRLHDMEEILFPPQIFVSPGFVIGSSTCSICEMEYGDCNHLKGKPYMGEMCTRIIRDIRACEEVSIVKEPASKRHRALQIGDGSSMRDVMSWRVVEGRGSKPEPRCGDAE